MNWDQIQGDWMQFKNKVRMNWVKLTDEDLTRIGGRREVLARTLQARYGFARAEAEREIDAWMKTQRHAEMCIRDRGECCRRRAQGR